MPDRLECCVPRHYAGALRHASSCRVHPSGKCNEEERAMLAHPSGTSRTANPGAVLIDGVSYGPATTPEELHSLRVLFDGEGYLDGDEADYDDGKGASGDGVGVSR